MLAAQEQPDASQEPRGDAINADDENDALIKGNETDAKKEAEGEDEGLLKKNNHILGMKVKKPTTFWNIFALLLIPSIKVAAHSFTNAKMNYLLQDEDYFDIEFDDIGPHLFTIMASGQVISVLLSPIFGYMYDVFGRVWVICGGLFTIAFTMMLLPFMAPSFGMLVFWRVVMSCAMRLMLVKPLLIDYLKDGSRGFGMTMQTWGFLFGEGIHGIMYGFTFYMGVRARFVTGAILVAAATTGVIYTIREPSIKDYRIMPDGTRDVSPYDPNLTFWERVKKLTSEAWHEILTRPKYLLIFILLAISRLINIMLQVYIQLWMIGYTKNGILKDTEHQNNAYSKFIIACQVGTLLTVPIFGYFCDSMDLRASIPSAFLGRALVCCTFPKIDNPESFSCYLAGFFLTSTTAIQFVSVEVMFMRKMKSTIRGTMYGFQLFFSGIMTTIFLLMSPWMFENAAPSTSFAMVGICDFIAVFISLFYFLRGIVKKGE